MARKAKESANLWADLKAVMSSAVRVIGSEVTPLINAAINAVIRSTVAARDWIKEHKGLFAAAGLAAGGIVAFGAAASLLGTVLGAVAGGVGTFLSVVMGLGSLLLSPWVLAGVAIAGVIGYVLKATSAFQNLANWLSSTFANVISEVTESFGVIGRALAAGEIGAAWKMTVAMIELEWVRVCNALEGYWEGVKAFYQDSVSGIAMFFVNLQRQHPLDLGRPDGLPQEAVARLGKQHLYGGAGRQARLHRRSRDGRLRRRRAEKHQGGLCI